MRTRSQKWKQQLVGSAAAAFGEREGRQQEGEIERLHEKHGELTMERDSLRACGGKAFRADRQALIDREAQMPITKQCQLLGLSRSSVYYRPVPVSEEELAIMRWLDERLQCYPFFGARKLTVMLNREGRAVGRKRVRRVDSGSWASSRYTGDPAPRCRRKVIGCFRTC
jgi:putative transposase